MAIVQITFNPLDGSTAIVNASTADSKAVVATADASTGIVNASTADSKAVVALADASTGIVDASTADSKAVVATADASTALAKANSAIGSEPAAGEYIVTDIKRDATGSIVIDYNDSAIGS